MCAIVRRKVTALQLLQTITLTWFVWHLLPYLFLLQLRLAFACSRLDSKKLLFVVHDPWSFILLGLLTEIHPRVILLRAFADEFETKLLAAVTMKKHSLYALRNVSPHILLLIILCRFYVLSSALVVSSVYLILERVTTLVRLYDWMYHFNLHFFLHFFLIFI